MALTWLASAGERLDDAQRELGALGVEVTAVKAAMHDKMAKPLDEAK